MNIILADVQSVNINQAGSAAELETGQSSFSDLMTKQLSQDSDLTTQVEYPQAVDIKALMLDSDEKVSGLTALFTERDNSSLNLDLANSPVPEVALQTLVISPVAEIDETMLSQVVDSQQALDELVDQAVNPALGELLPTKGKALPPTEIAAFQQPTASITAPVLAPQGELTRNSRPVTVTALNQESLDIDAVVRLVENRPIESVIPKATDLPAQIKADLPVETFNFNKAGEFQVSVNANGDAIEQNPAAIRSLTALHASVSTQSPTASLPPQLETLTLANPKDTGAWGNGLGERINWMVNQKLNTATIRMDPPMLGRLDVQIQVTDDATNVTINAQHAQTRDLIDNASFRLREFLQENGYENVNVDVSHQQQQGQQASDQTSDEVGTGADEGARTGSANEAEQTLGNRYFASDSVVDYFA